ncbi:amidohydrolase family protein [Phytohalomonas tamaricis]|uniref:amidohydrolase family protein n=1 Tax=Phytohalomonas tamaricis TaxID=2081032 RepID=UPI000D0AFCFD|nr:amidohydrolase family protein [Phytohalomonas tamaricis]
MSNTATQSIPAAASSTSDTLFDAHFHIIDPRFPLASGQDYSPPTFTAHDYHRRVAPLGIAGGAVVSGSFQGFDQRYLCDALDRLGAGYVGVTQLPPEVSDEEIRALNQRGVRAVRFNLRRGGSAGLEVLEEMALRVHALAGWHVELYADARELSAHLPVLKRLPQLVIDHLGLSREGLPTLCTLVEHGAKVKASGFGRVSLDVPQALATIADIAPSALMFGSDLPSTRAPRPFNTQDITLIHNTLGERNARLALHDNAVALYRPHRLPPVA